MNERSTEDIGTDYWLDQPKNISLIIWILIFICVSLFFADAIYYKNSHFDIETLFGFYGLYGFFVCVALVLIAKALRKILMRNEEYYEIHQEGQNAHSISYRAHD
jgi:uncharacterized membrane protein